MCRLVAEQRAGRSKKEGRALGDRADRVLKKCNADEGIVRTIEREIKRLRNAVQREPT